VQGQPPNHCGSARLRTQLQAEGYYGIKLSWGA
jgi:hypothetical protein